MLDQSELVDARDGLLAAPPLGAFRTFQAPIADIGGLTGVDLGAVVAADVLPLRTARPAEWRPLTAAEDILL